MYKEVRILKHSVLRNALRAFIEPSINGAVRTSLAALGERGQVSALENRSGFHCTMPL
jgi:hypothetical protein